MDAFFDMEFSMGKDRCDVISLACVIRDNDQIIDQFYTLTKPTKKLHWTAKRITKLKDKDLVNAISLKEALTEFNTWINFYNITNIYNIGNCDKKVLSICCNRDGTDYLLKPFEMLEDVQEKISASVLLDGKQYFKQISLQNLKYLYDIDGKVSHNSLDDAIDLLNVYNAFEKIIETAISQEHQDSPATVIENNDDTYMGNEEIESMSAALKGLIDDDIYEQSRKVPEPPFDVEAMDRSLDEYFYYTGEGKDRFDEWLDYSRA